MLLKLRENMTIKLKSLITLSLLFAISFSMLHEYAFAFYDDEHCSTTEYVLEFQGPSLHESSDLSDNTCKTHFEYHQAYLLFPNSALLQGHSLRSNTLPTKETYQFLVSLDFIKPPIS